jgi:23S rRNA pseudouridine2605 synthase
LREKGIKDETVRLQVFLARAGVASRRAAENIISSGRVQVNGITITAMGVKVRNSDIILLDGKPLHAENRKLHLALNKPEGYICSSNDPQGRPLALDLLSSKYKERLYNIGRLDYLSCGLILFTNDGRFASKLSHPGCGFEKEYMVEATGYISDAVIDAFNNGITIENIYYKAKYARRTGEKSVKIILIEGKNREIRRVFSHFHLHPALLRRVRIGPVLLGDLAPAQSRSLTEPELEDLNKSIVKNQG